MWSTSWLPLFPGPFKLRMVVPVKVQFMSQIDLFKNYLYSIGPCAKHKNPLKKQLHKNVNVNMIPNL